MRLHSLGNSDLQVPPIIFGCWAIGGWCWGGTDDKLAKDAIHASIDSGINTFDTAPIYGFGHSETILGKALRGKRHETIIMTKVGLRWQAQEGAPDFDNGNRIYRNLRPDSIQLEVEQSLRRLQTDYIDLLQCHWPDPQTEVEETMEALADLVKQGKVRAIGVSNFGIDLLERSVAKLGTIPLASNQPRYSLLDRKVEKTILPWCRKNNVGNIVYSPIEQGLLSGTVTPDRIFAKTDGRATDPKFSKNNRLAVLKALQQVEHICQAHHCTFAQLAAAWCFHQPGITAAIVGARNALQAVENANSAEIQLRPTEQMFLSNHFEALKLGQQT